MNEDNELKLWAVTMLLATYEDEIRAVLGNPIDVGVKMVYWMAKTAPEAEELAEKYEQELIKQDAIEYAEFYHDGGVVPVTRVQQVDACLVPPIPCLCGSLKEGDIVSQSSNPDVTYFLEPLSSLKKRKSRRSESDFEIFILVDGKIKRICSI